MSTQSLKKNSNLRKKKRKKTVHSLQMASSTSHGQRFKRFKELLPTEDGKRIPNNIQLNKTIKTRQNKNSTSSVFKAKSAAINAYGEHASK